MPGCGKVIGRKLPGKFAEVARQELTPLRPMIKFAVSAWRARMTLPPQLTGIEGTGTRIQAPPVVVTGPKP
jgi:hypothetical protein